jgi:hypothetical protein
VRRLACDVKKWPADKAVEFRHSTKAPCTASPCKTEQNGFGLVVSSVARQNNGSAVAFGGAPQSLVARVASGRLGSSFGSNRNADILNRVQPQRDSRL